jgi:hypothetical protein
MKRFLCSIAAFLFSFSSVMAQDDLLSLIPQEKKSEKEYIINAFKSSRVINGHSMEMIGEGILDTRILHRFGTLNAGFSELFGLDQANMRIGFDYGVTKDLTVGVGRSNVGKELDGFVKYRIIHQSTGGKNASPVSLIWVSGMTWNTQKWASATQKGNPTDRLAYYHQLIIGRKFSEAFSAQISPTLVHLNLIQPNQPKNDIGAIGLGARMKLSKRVAFVVDYHLVLEPTDSWFSFEDDDDDDDAGNAVNNYINPLSIGFDIETGGHVFQLHFSNATGMNEKSFIAQTNQTWGRGEIRFGFNLSRVFAVRN